MERPFLRRQAGLTSGEKPFSFDWVQGSCLPAGADSAAAFTSAAVTATGEACTATALHSYLETAFADAAEFGSNLSLVFAMSAGHEGESTHGKPLDSLGSVLLPMELEGLGATDELAPTAAGPSIAGAATAANTVTAGTLMRVFVAFPATAVTARGRTVATVAMRNRRKGVCVAPAGGPAATTADSEDLANPASHRTTDYDRSPSDAVAGFMHVGHKIKVVITEPAIEPPMTIKASPTAGLGD